MFLSVGDLELEILGHGDYPFFGQVVREIAEEYDFDSIPFKPGDVVIDVGAHIGIVSIYLAKRFGVRVYAYEPEPANFASLVMNIGANQAEVIPRNLAVTADGRSLSFHYGAHSGEGGVWADLDARQHKGRANLDVDSTTVEAILRTNEITRARLLKLDCEGAEHEILAGSKGWKSQIGYLRGEIHLNARLRDAGYTVDKTLAAFPAKRAKWQICEATS